MISTEALYSLWSKGFDLGLVSESEQLRTTVQMRKLAIENHEKHMAEINKWLKNQEKNLKARIKEKASE